MKVMCCGSFDPISKGHEDIILRAAVLFDTVYVVVADNASKNRLFTGPQRLRFCQETFAGRENIQVLLHDGLIADLAAELGVGALVKGVRCGTDFEYEKQLFEINRLLLPSLETVLLPAAKELEFISSSCVREFLRFGRELSSVVPDRVVDEIKNTYAERK